MTEEMISQALNRLGGIRDTIDTIGLWAPMDKPGVEELFGMVLGQQRNLVEILEEVLKHLRE